MVSRRVSVVVDADVSPYNRGLMGAVASTKAFAHELESADSRMAALVQSGLMLAPALVPLGAAAIPAISGLTTQLGFAAAAAGVTALAFNGIGDALKTVSDYELKPTTENLAKMQIALRDVGPAGAEMVKFLASLRPQLSDLQDVAREGMFPGMQEGIEDLLTRLPEIEDVVQHISSALGELSAEAGESLASPKWDAFFTYLSDTARPILLDMGHAFGAVISGLSSMVMAFDPLSQNFSRGLLDMAESFETWSQNLADSEGFAEFTRYLTTNGPRALDALESIGNALIELVEAAAPVGSALLPVISGLADGLAAIADSPAGPVLVSTAAAIGVIGRSLAVIKALGLSGGKEGIVGKALGVSKLKGSIPTMSQVGTSLYQMGQSAESASASTLKARESVRGFARAAAPAVGVAGALALSMTDVDDKMGLSHTASFAMMGLLGGPWGAAVGAAVGLTMDFAAANDELESSVRAATAALDSYDVSKMQTALDKIKADMADQGWMGDVWDEVTGHAEETGSAIRLLEDGINTAKNSTGGFATVLAGSLAPNLGYTSGQFETAEQSAADFAQSLEHVNNVLEGRASFRDYQAALDTFTAGLKENGQAFRNFTDAGRTNNANLDRIASTALKIAQDLKGMDRIKFLDKARGQFLDAAQAMGVPEKKAKQLADSLELLDKKDPKVKVTEDGSEATKRKVKDVQKYVDVLGGSVADPLLTARDKANPFINAVRANLHALDGDHAETSITTTYYEKHNISYAGVFGPKTTNANGSITDYFANGSENHVAQIAPAGAYRVWAEEETGGEAYIPLAPSKRERSLDIWREVGDRMGVQFHEFATGGFNFDPRSYAPTASGPVRSLDDRLAIAQVLQQIRDLKRSLAKDGKEALKGMDRHIAALELEKAQVDLRAAKHREEREKRQEAKEKAKEAVQKARDTRSTVRGLFDNLDTSWAPEGHQSQMPATSAAIAQMMDLKKQVLDAGGQWSRGLEKWSDSLIRLAGRTDRLNDKIATETAKRDALVEKLSDQQQALDQLTQTMQSYSDSVAGKFLTDPFGGAHTVTTPGQVDPTLAANLSAAEQQLIAIRNSASGDSVASAAAASKLLPQIAAMRAEVEKQSQPVETMVSGLQAMRDELQKSTADALAMADALKTLAAKGLDTDGPLGGLYASLAASGDFATAEELAALSADQIDEYEKLFATREDAAAAVGALATQAVYGKQQVILETAVNATTAAITKQDATIAVLNERLAVVGDRVQIGAHDGTALALQPLNDRLQSLENAVKNQAAQIRDVKRAGKGRG